VEASDKVPKNNNNSKWAIQKGIITLIIIEIYVLFYPPSSNLWEHGGCPSAPLTHKVCKTYPQSLGVCLTDFNRPKQYTSLNKLLAVKHTSLLHELSTNNYSKNYVKLSPVSSWTFIKFQRSNISTLVRLHCLNILYELTLRQCL